MAPPPPLSPPPVAAIPAPAPAPHAESDGDSGCGENLYEDDEYEASKILERKLKEGKRQRKNNPDSDFIYLVHFTDFDHADDAWIPFEDLDCPEILAAFKRETGIASTSSKSVKGRKKR